MRCVRLNVAMRLLAIGVMSVWLGCDVFRTTPFVSANALNPPAIRLETGAPGNLLDSGEFAAKRLNPAPHAITPELAEQMQRHGIAADLDGLIDLLTRPLGALTDMAPEEKELAVWMLTVRNTFWSSSNDKSAEVHIGEAGDVLLLLREEGRGIARCYVEEEGDVVEYVLEVRR